jgi:uncharacterized protein
MKDLDDKDRDLPIRWNIMHMYSSSQIAKIIAIKRGLDIEIASIAAALHDIAVVVTKRTKNHAVKAESVANDFIDKYNNVVREDLPKINKEERKTIIKAIINHSDKETFTDDPMVELIKDVDSIDRYLHGVESEGAYLKRCEKVQKELSLLF